MDVKEIGPDRAEELETLVGELWERLVSVAGTGISADLEDYVRYSVELDRIKRNR